MEERSPTPPPPKLLDQVRDRLRVKHYSIRTEAAPAVYALRNPASLETPGFTIHGKPVRRDGHSPNGRLIPPHPALAAFVHPCTAHATSTGLNASSGFRASVIRRTIKKPVGWVLISALAHQNKNRP